MQTHNIIHTPYAHEIYIQWDPLMNLVYIRIWDNKQLDTICGLRFVWLLYEENKQSWLMAFAGLPTHLKCGEPDWCHALPAAHRHLILFSLFSNI